VAAEVLCSGDAFRSGQHYRLRPCPYAVPVCDEAVPDIASGATTMCTVAIPALPAKSRAAAYPAALQGTNSRGLVSTGSQAEAVKSTEAI
jgi:hypothetical protein